MVFSLTVISLSAILVLVAFLYPGGRRWKNAPPRPKGCPIFGHLLQISKIPHYSFTEWAKKLGPIFRLDLFHQRCVILSDPALMKEAYNHADTSGRMALTAFGIIDDGKLHGITMTDGATTSELKTFTINTLVDMGLGKKGVEENIMKEVGHFLSELKGVKLANQIQLKLSVPTVNALFYMVFGKRYENDDPKLLNVSTSTRRAFADMSDTGMLLFLVPWLGKIFPNLTRAKRIRSELDATGSFFHDVVQEHKTTMGERMERDFVDKFLLKIKECDDPESAFYGEKGELHLVSTLFDLFAPGAAAASATLAWMILFLSKHKDVQKKVQEEIASVTKGRLVELSDKGKLSYTEAVIAEVFRYSCVDSVGLPHRTMNDCTIGGYSIPKDTMLISNNYYSLWNPETYPEPDVFRPERFLMEVTDEGGNVSKVFNKALSDTMLPFSTGKRKCPFEYYSRNVIFLFGANIFQKYDITFDTSGPDHGLDAEIIFALAPLDYRVHIRSRDEN